MDELNEYYADDQLSEKLLKSIPVKVLEWLRTMEKRYNVTLLHQGNSAIDYDGQRIRLSVIGFSTGASGTLTFGDDCEPDFVKFWWDENFDNLRTSDLALVNAARDLEVFVEAEKKFYDELTLLERELDYKHGAGSKFSPNHDGYTVINEIRQQHGLEPRSAE